MKTHDGWNYRVLVVGIRWWTLALAAFTTWQAAARPDFYTNSYGFPKPNKVRSEVHLSNNTKEAVDDWHAHVSSKATISGGRVVNSFFPETSFTDVSNDGHSFEVTLSGNTFPPPPDPLPKDTNPDKVKINIAAYLWGKEINDTHCTWWWTQGGVPMEPKAGITFDLEHPKKTVQKSPGSAYIHKLTLSNPGETDLSISGVSFLASMNYVETISSLPWNTVPGSLASPTTLKPGEEMTFDLLTQGSFDQGHLYLSVATGGGETHYYFDHPVFETVPEPETWAMLAGLGLAGFAVGRRVHAQRAGRREHPKSS